MRKYVIGVDGGGTKTIANLSDLKGNVIAEASSGPSNPHYTNADELEANLREAIESTLRQAIVEYSDVLCIFLGIAGVRKAEETSSLTKTVRRFVPKSVKVLVDHDLRIALTAGVGASPGIVAVSGTGSACYGRNAQGKEYRTSSNDIGSGSWIGAQALRDALSANANPQLKTALTNHFHGVCPELETLERHQVAALYPLIANLSMQGNASAKRIVTAGVEGVNQLILETQAILKLKEIQIVLAGGLMSTQPYQSILQNKIKTSLPNAKFIIPSDSQARGAVYEALIRTGIQISDLLPNNHQ
ncbi:hypothetical protein MLD52_22315 [Puniceicoccaceae bacterium K14]|nr:hypothetical protein [Puniceicoccaceae bacterium K14]